MPGTDVVITPIANGVVMRFKTQAGEVASLEMNAVEADEIGSLLKDRARESMRMLDASIGQLISWLNNPTV